MKKLPIVTFILVFLFLIAIGVGIYFYLQYKQTQNLLLHPSATSDQQVVAIVDKVSKLMELPTGETPTLATVQDITKLKNQPFFLHAKNGDVVLIYTKAKTAILYDPATNKIVTVAPLTISQQITPSPVPSVIHIALYSTNASSSASLPTVSKDLTTKFANVAVVSEAEAKKKYKSNLVVDISGKEGAIAAQMAQEVQGVVGTLPSGETTPTGADILVILTK